MGKRKYLLPTNIYFFIPWSNHCAALYVQILSSLSSSPCRVSPAPIIKGGGSAMKSERSRPRRRHIPFMREKERAFYVGTYVNGGALVRDP